MKVVIARAALLLVCAAPLALVPVPAAAAQASAAQPAVAPLAYRTRTLANGLRVYALRDTSTPNVAIQVWYDVGSKDDPAGRSGFAHMFEHLMFKATRNLVPEQFDRLTEDVGGSNNASTNDDYTNYFEVVPANHLERLLWAEAERMGSLVVEPGFFASERDVVKEELRSRVLAQPYGKMLYLYYPQISYDVHPYARPGIGSIADLDAATVDDVRAFHALYYRPDNAVLVVSGNFDDAQLDGWIDRYFAPIERPTMKIPRVRIAEPDRTRARSFTVYEPNTPLPAVLISYPAPPAADADTAAFEVLGAILSAGQSSRLYQSLIYRDQLASQADAFVDIKQGRGNLAVFAIMAGGKDAAAGETALRAEIARLRNTPVTAAELSEARNELVTAALRGRETVDGRADAIAEAVIVAGDAAAADKRIADIAAVTPADIRRVARKWLRDQASASLRYLPEEAKPAGATGDVIATPATVRSAALVTPPGIQIVQPAAATDRVAPPAPGPDVVSPVPAPDVRKLANGLTVITVARRDLPLVSAALVARGGSAADPDGKAGRGELAASVITQGTRTRSATEIAQAAEALGTSLGSGTDWDGSSLSMTVKSDQIDPALAILADVAQHPAFAAEELERQRAIAADSVTVQLKDPGALSRLVASRALYGDTPYGHPSGGTPASLKAITRDDLAAAYAAQWAPANATLILTGDIEPASAQRLAERHFGSWQADAATAAPPPGSVAAGPQLIVVDMPGAGQAAVAVTRGAIARSDPRFYEAMVANAVLGTGFSSRLNQEIRIKRGLAYGAGSGIDARRGEGPFIAATQTKNASAPEVLGLILAEMKRLGADPVPAAELDSRKAVLNGSFGRNIETTGGLAGIIANYVMKGIDPAEIGRYQQSIAAVTPAKVNDAARALIDPAGATLVIVGDAKEFLPALRAQGREPIVIPAASLDLDSADLR